MATQGKCDTCKIRWVWKNDTVPLKHKKCFKCGGRLKRTRKDATAYRTITFREGCG